MRWSERRLPALVLVAATMTGAAACAGGDLASSRRSGRTYGTETWHEPSIGATPTELVVRFDGPAGDPGTECEPDREASVENAGDAVELTIKRYSPSPVVACPVTPQAMTVTLPAPLGDRPLVNPQTGWRFLVTEGRLVLDEDSTQCGRADCSAPAVAKASCNPMEYGGVINEQIAPPREADADVRCDGSFLALTRNGKRVWFVNRAAAWQLVAGNPTSCDDIWRQQRIRFPGSFCM